MIPERNPGIWGKRENFVLLMLRERGLKWDTLCPFSYLCPRLNSKISFIRETVIVSYQCFEKDYFGLLMAMWNYADSPFKSEITLTVPLKVKSYILGEDLTAVLKVNIVEGWDQPSLFRA